MKQPPYLFVLLPLLLAGFVGGCGNTKPAPLTGTADSSLVRQIEALQLENDQIKARLAALERPVTAPPETIQPEQADGELKPVLANHITEQVAAEIGELDLLTPERVDEQIAAFIEMQRQEQLAEEAAIEAEYMAEERAVEERRQARMKEMQAEFDIGPEKLRRLQLAQETIRRGEADVDEGNLSPDERSRAFDALRKAHKEMLESFMSEQHVLQYLERYADLTLQ